MSSQATADHVDLAGLRRDVRAFIRDEMGSLALRRRCDCWMAGVSPAFSAALGARGWVGMTLPAVHGGGGRTSRERLAVSEELLAAGAPVAAHWFADRQVGPALVRHGTPEQQERYLPGIIAGTTYFAIGMSEPDSGSDLASVRTTATRVGGGWSINGRKVWTSHAQFAHHLLALVRTAPRDPTARHGGLSQLIIDLEAPGVTVRPIMSLDGESHFNEVVLEDVLVPEAALLGREGAGWSQVTQELGLERSGPERFLSTMPLWRAWTESTPLSDPRHGLLLAEVQTLRHMSARISDGIDRGESLAVDTALVKDLGTEFESRVTDHVRRVGGVRPDRDAAEECARLLAEAVLHAPDATLRGGTNEILRGIVARSLRSS